MSHHQSPSPLLLMPRRTEWTMNCHPLLTENSRFVLGEVDPCHHAVNLIQYGTWHQIDTAPLESSKTSLKRAVPSWPQFAYDYHRKWWTMIALSSPTFLRIHPVTLRFGALTSSAGLFSVEMVQNKRKAVRTFHVPKWSKKNKESDIIISAFNPRRSLGAKRVGVSTKGSTKGSTWLTWVSWNGILLERLSRFVTVSRSYCQNMGTNLTPSWKLVMLGISHHVQVCSFTVYYLSSLIVCAQSLHRLSTCQACTSENSIL